MNILFTWKYNNELLDVDCKLTKNHLDKYDSSIKVHSKEVFTKCIYHFDILNILGKHEYKIFYGTPDSTMLSELTEIILEQIEIIRPYHLN